MKNQRARWAVVAAVALAWGAAAMACSSSNDSPGPATTTSTGHGVVGASGGDVATADGLLTVSVPSGALPADTTITISEIASPASGAIGKAYEIGPSGTQFAVPVTLKFKYAGDDLLGNDPSSLEVATIVGSDWVALSGNAVDTSTQIASGQTTHLSPYGIHAKSKGNDHDGGGTTPDAGGSGTDAGQDSGAKDAGFDAAGCQFVGQQVGTCANLPIQICQQGMALTNCTNYQPQGWRAYCCPPGTF
jgi:hypothetical protein